MKFRACDLFCGAGGAAMGLHRAGFEVEGWDINPQPHYPFKFHQGDALAADLTGFDFVWASPPCQKHSVARHIHGDPGYECYIVRTRKKLVAAGLPFIVDNVIGAPLCSFGMLCGTMFGLKVFRHRIFESNCAMLFPAHSRHDGSTGAKDGYSVEGRNRNGFICVAGNNYNREQGAKAMGIDWMTRGELSEAIPPAYSEFLGRQIIQYLNRHPEPGKE